MISRRSVISFLTSKLGAHELIWGGLRADDVEAISDLAQVGGSFSIIGGYDRGGAIPSLVDFENLAGVREDLDNWDIDDHLDSEPAQGFREAILRKLAEPTALLPYRPSRFLSAILFARRDRCIDLGLFGGHQALFEHKPWVETMLSAEGIPTVAWTYVADEERSLVRRLLMDGPVVLRVTRSSGGVGFVRVDTDDELDANWPRHPEAFASVAAFLDQALPINIGATVWHDGVTMHHPSIQLVGIPECTARPFGYCGNDFGLAAELDAGTLDAIEQSVMTIGRWLHRYQYLGTFGVDFLVDDGVPLFAEINPRFQGSTHASSQLSSEAGDSCVILDHLAATLGHDAPDRRPLREIAASMPAFAHVVVHWIGPPAEIEVGPLVSALRQIPSHVRTDVVAKPSLRTNTGAVIARTTVRDRLTSSGFDLAEPWRGVLRSWIRATRDQTDPQTYVEVRP